MFSASDVDVLQKVLESMARNVFHFGGAINGIDLLRANTEEETVAGSRFLIIFCTSVP